MSKEKSRFDREHPTDGTYDIDEAMREMEQEANNESSQQAEAAGADAAASDSVAAMQAKYDELYQKYLRQVADYQNYTRRAQQNLEQSRQLQLMDIAKSLVTVVDHFDRALEHEADASGAQTLMQGVKIVHEELLRTLERYGITRYDVKPGDEFDPNVHEAMMRQPHDDIPANHVVSQLQPGYALGDKTVRPAKVIVARAVDDE